MDTKKGGTARKLFRSKGTAKRLHNRKARTVHAHTDADLRRLFSLCLKLAVS